MVKPQTPIESLSKRVFGTKHRLSIALAVEDRLWDSLFDHDGAITASGAPRTAVFTELQALAEIGALQRVEVNGRVLYQALDGPFWRWCSDLAELFSLGRSRRHEA